MLTVFAIVTMLSSQSWNQGLFFGTALLLGMQLITVVWISHWTQTSMLGSIQASPSEIPTEEKDCLKTGLPEVPVLETGAQVADSLGEKQWQMSSILVFSQPEGELPMLSARKRENHRKKDGEKDEQQAELDNLRWLHHLAYDRYDGLGQSLTALNIQLQTALKLWETNPVQAQAFLVIAYEQGLAAMQEVRRSISMLQVDPVASDRPSPSPEQTL